jgi:SusD family.
MKVKYITFLKYCVLGVFFTAMTTGCDDYLDITPPSTIPPENYLNSESQLASYVVAYYGNYTAYNKMSDDKGGQLPSTLGTGGETPLKDDVATDNETGKNGSSSRFLPGEKEGSWKVGQTGGKWNFYNIYALNFYLNEVVPKYEAGQISGNDAAIKHYIGVGYFLRAHEYFYRLRYLGDFPIITTVQPDEKAALVEASKRKPRNEVARFILQDLDKAIELMSDNAPTGGKTRVNKKVALLLKARVALFEGTWETYHKGTAFVPNGSGWTGAGKDYNSGYKFPSGSLEGEIDFFLTEAMKAAEQIADVIPLASNNGKIAEGFDYAGNSYYDMFANLDPTGIDEVLMARLYKDGIQTHWFNHYFVGGGNIGYTKQFEKSFLMDNGLPFYAPGSNYAGDDLIGNTKKDRDSRWQIFMKAPLDVQKVKGTTALARFPEYPNLESNDGKVASSTGYIHGKGYSLDAYQGGTMGNDATASVVFRATEAYLIYMEACYVKNGSLDSKAQNYWKALRRRALVNEDFNKTIAATNMAEEAKYDWGAYSKGQLIDPTLYNIRRERRCEFVGEGFRLDDLLRWRALDQLNGFQIEGAKVWGDGMKDYYTANPKGISPENLSPYFRPYQITATNNNYYNGLFFAPAHYLDPIAVEHFIVSSEDDASPEKSPIYQNPGWGLESGKGCDTSVK